MTDVAEDGYGDRFDRSTPEALRAEILRLVAAYSEAAHQSQPFRPGVSPVPVSGRVYGVGEMQLLVESALDFWLTTGRFNEAFEAKLARYLGTRYLMTCNSGSSANLLAVTALTSHLLGDRRLIPGDEVITCATGFPTTINPILQNNLVPVFLDVDIPTYNLNVSGLEAALSPRTRAVALAHTLGNPFDVATVTDFARRHDLYLIEDCCDALGATYDGAKVGMFGDVGTLSFYPAHHITMGEGGAVFCQSSRLKRALESLRDWGRDCYCAPGHDDTCKKRFGWAIGELPYGYDHKYIYSHLGYNLKITDMQAAVGLGQLDRLDAFIAARKRNYGHLRSGLAGMEDRLILPEATPGSDPSWFGFPITLRDAGRRNALVEFLNGRRIGTRLLFGGNLTRQPYMRERSFRTIGDLAASDRVMNDTFWIGVYPGLVPDAIGYMIDAIGDFFAGRA
ncbi:lipopolysaccharide biosynthesis protein RfbH [Methylobacterium nigriterrae]|uniref:lipopolysaccharide biosynthesis protein RfbH n=1 Tax=Methylobacterium nigriterrae TaxID=3127512 RepID=UPI0030133B54